MTFSKLSMKFVPGIVLSACVFALYSFGSTMIQSGESVTVEAANSMYSDYKNNTPANEAVNPFVVNLYEANKIAEILLSNSELTAVRVYPGKSDGADVAVLVGVDANLRDNTNYIYTTDLRNSGTCPPLCDANSAITGE